MTLLFFLIPAIYLLAVIFWNFHIYKNKTYQILIALIIFLGCSYFIIHTQGEANKHIFNNFFTGLNWWQDFIDPLIGISVLMVTISIWLSKAKTEWEDELPNRLTVRFIYENNELMRCEEAPLIHESDIRQWSQQIGLQMVNQEGFRFSMEPYFEIDQPVPQKDSLSNEYFLHYSYNLYLYEKPDIKGLSSEQLQDYDHVEQLQENDTLVWKILNRKPRALKEGAASKMV